MFRTYGLSTRVFNCLVALECDFSSEQAARAGAAEVLANGRFQRAYQIGKKSVRELAEWVGTRGGPGCGQTCANCRAAYVETKENRTLCVGALECRRLAPRALLMMMDGNSNLHRAKWPPVSPDDWCCEWLGRL